MKEDVWKLASLVIGVISGAIGLAKLVFLPAWKAWRKWRETHPPFRKRMLRGLERMEEQLNATGDQARANMLSLARLEEAVTRNDEYFSAMLRERLESAYTVYAIRMGWCPSGEKRMLMDLFDLHESRGWNHVNRRYREIIASLPESEAERERKTS